LTQIDSSTPVKFISKLTYQTRNPNHEIKINQKKVNKKKLTKPNFKAFQCWKIKLKKINEKNRKTTWINTISSRPESRDYDNTIKRK
jgi:1-deoxy-D-xylulose 5-phosphate reductoisomerase